MQAAKYRKVEKKWSFDGINAELTIIHDSLKKKLRVMECLI